MSALARYFHFMGKAVAGYDKTPGPITKGLEELGIQVHYQDRVELLSEPFRNPKTLVVYTPAVPAAHAQLNHYREGGFTIMKRSQVLGIITRDTYCLAVAGTHGKTTTSAILAHLMKQCNMPFTAFLGGVSEDFNSNFVMEGSRYSVVEADEFDRSFLQLSPDLACITSMDADHLDIYGNREELQRSFRDFASRLKPGGTLFVREGLPLEGLTYGIGEGTYRIENINVDGGGYLFDIMGPNGEIRGVRFPKPGRHNLLNALVAFAMAEHCGCDPQVLCNALGSFKGVQRRFSYQIRKEGFAFIDDYAHHPTEIDAVHQAVREVHPGEKIRAVFQPHLFSRTRDFVDDFAKSLSAFDEVLLLDIYPAREEPIPGVDSRWLLEKIENPNKGLIGKEELLKKAKHWNTGVLLMIGAGDIGLEVPKMKKILSDAD